MKINLTPYEKVMTIIDELIKGLATVAVLFSIVIVLVALWVLFHDNIQEALRAAQGVMFG